jgi:adenylate cyclase
MLDRTGGSGVPGKPDALSGTRGGSGTMRFRITFILMVAIGGLTAVAVGTVLFVSASTSIRNTLELMRSRAELTISAVERGVFDYMEPARDLIADLSRRVTEGTLDISDRKSLAEILSGALAAVPQIGGVVVWQPSGSGLWVDRHSDGIHVETQTTPDRAELVDFLARAEKAKDIQWGAPYYREGATYITLASPLFKDGAYVGVIAAGVSVVAPSNFVRHELTESDVTAFVLYGKDKVLAHPALLDPDYSGRVSAEMPLLSVDAVGDPVLAEFPSLPIKNLGRRADFDVRDTGERGNGEVVLSRSTDADIGFPRRSRPILNRERDLTDDPQSVYRYPRQRMPGLACQSDCARPTWRPLGRFAERWPQ